MRTKLIVLIMMCFFTLSAQADTARENENLARIVHVLDALQPLLQEAETQQAINERVLFDYAALRQDIGRIKAGIQRKFAHNQLEPRIIQPLQGDYLNVRAMPKP